jgi:hypothetical protein
MKQTQHMRILFPTVVTNHLGKYGHIAQIPTASSAACSNSWELSVKPRK